MGSFDFDKKKEHEALAEKALKNAGFMLFKQEESQEGKET